MALPPALSTLDTFVAAHPTDAGYQIAEAYAWLGNHDQAFAWLDRAKAHHETDLIYVKYDPLLRGLHTDARFDLLLEAMGLPPSSPSPVQPSESP